jgi:hypothetical protein
MVCFRYIIVNTMHKGDKMDDDDDDDSNNNNKNNNNNSDNDDDDNNNNSDDDDKLRDQSSIQKCHINIGLISSSYRGMNIYSKYRVVNILSRCCAMSI